MNLRRLHKTQADVRVERQLKCLCNEIYGGSSLGLASSVIYIKGKRGRIFDPYERDSDAVMNWLADNHINEFQAAVKAYSGKSDTHGIRVCLIKKALEVAHLLQRTDEYLGMKISYPSEEPDVYFPFCFFANDVNLKSFIKDPTGYLVNVCIDLDTGSRFIRRAIDYSIKCARGRFVRLNAGGVFLGVMSRKFVDDATLRPVPIRHICTFAYYSCSDKNIYDFGTDCINVAGGIKTKLDQLSCLGIEVDLRA